LWRFSLISWILITFQEDWVITARGCWSDFMGKTKGYYIFDLWLTRIWWKFGLYEDWFFLWKRWRGDSDLLTKCLCAAENAKIIIRLSEVLIVKLHCFEEEMMVKENSIKIREEELEKKISDQENSITVDKPVDRTQWMIDTHVDHTQQRRHNWDFGHQHKTVDRPVDSPLGLVDNQTPKIGFRFSFQACSCFFSSGLQIELKFYSLKDVFLNIEGSRVVLHQENQLL